MASLLCSHLLPVSYPTRTKTTKQCRTETRALSPQEKASPGNGDDSLQKSTKLVTFLGKGGSGKTTSALFAAKHYAMAGLSTCLVIHNQDPTSDYLLNCKIGNSPVLCQTNLSAVRLETTKMLLEPLDRLKQADKRLNLTQGVLGEIVGEELGILPGMDSIFSAISLERYVGFLTNFARKNHQKDIFDVIVYDGICTEETIRMLGAASKARLYLKYLWNISEKTELGRLASPSLLRLVVEAMSVSSSSNNSLFSGRTSPVIWENLEQMLEKGSSSFLSPHKFGCFIVMDPTNPISVDSALRYWGRTIQAGSLVSGAFGFLNSTTSLEEESVNRMKDNFSPLPFALIPHLSFSSPIDMNSVLVNSSSEGFRDLLSLSTRQKHGLISPVKFDKEKKTVTLFMPGFEKSEIKLYQYRGGSELLVEAGDQRRVILLPKEIQGKVGGAKFSYRNLIITMR